MERNPQKRENATKISPFFLQIRWKLFCKFKQSIKMPTFLHVWLHLIALAGVYKLILLSCCSMQTCMSKHSVETNASASTNSMLNAKDQLASCVRHRWVLQLSPNSNQALTSSPCSFKDIRQKKFLQHCDRNTIRKLSEKLEIGAKIDL